MGIWLGPRGSAGLKESDFTYSGNYLFKSEGRRWELALLSGNAASLVFSRNPGRVDIFAVGGGQSGQYYSGGSQDAYYGPSNGGVGGKGGECVSLRGVRLAANTNYAATIGGADQSTSLVGGDLNLIAATAGGSDGGSGGLSTQDGKVDASPGVDGVYAYGENSDTMLFTETEFPGHRFGSGGGGAGSMLQINQSNNSANANGGESNGPNHEYGKGGGYSSHDGSAGYPNHGQGGGGPYFYRITTGGGRNAYGNPGAGGSGIIMIRGAL